ncbi:GNAT family N-acetyltransferase [Novosphingobium sp.]|uniref:GNAT family N-acetyltransferase n=1 Tax=Novosphingobium sp. TaxID=1874826 RepID=UPI002B466428|nr:GNAT family N-acetyltransferase [Novosphingobium sp.]HKR93646.1 GNAT family N-acetyltransferase [Novosphingobium sp.]
MVVLKFRKATEADPLRGWVPAEHYDIVSGSEVVGTIQLRLGNTEYMRLYGGHIGYGIEPQHRGHGYAGAAIKELTSIARQHGFHEIWITCRPDNIASWRTLEKAGATYEGTVNVPLDSDLYARGDLQMRRYRLTIGPQELPPSG